MKPFYLILLFFSIAISCGDRQKAAECPDRRCTDFASQSDAQAAFDDDPDCSAEMDNDNDGIACEELANGGNGGGGAGCPTTANCGCSNKLKAECESACCKWVVGTGCVCR